MCPRIEVARRFFAWLLANLLFVALSLLFMKPRDIPSEPASATIFLQALIVGSLFTLSIINLSAKVNDEVFSRRMAASVLFTLLILLKFDRADVGHLLSISNPVLSAMLTFWAILIVVNVALQSLHKLSPSNFR
ncbi:MAG: hypothetical protein LC785_16410 [Acidobacteria bacterium]|nr:hypothetical protein [Acidobacteriota bacterium]MCA1643487.1 hypothetical protein [Acidobacteriota bacterium]